MRLLLWSLTPHAMVTTDFYATLKQTSTVLSALAFTIMVSVLGCGSPNSEDTTVDQPKVESTYDCEECPTFTDGKDTLAFVNEVRSFIAHHADAGLIENSACQNLGDALLDTFPVQTLLDLFEKDLGTGSPEVCSKLMVKILLENGLDAYVYSFGPRGSDVTHSAVLVKHEEDLWVVDPRLNYTLLKPNGSPMSLFELIEQVGKGNLQYTTSQEFVEGDLLLDYRIMPPSFFEWKARTACAEMFSNEKVIRDSITKTVIKRCFTCEQERSCFSLSKRMETALQQTTGLSDYHEVLALPNAAVHGAPDAQEVSDRIQSHIYSQPNLGKRVKAIK